MNWKNIINDLVASGFTQAEIAHMAGVSQPTIAGLLSGGQRDMRWSNGHRLLVFHAKQMGLAPRRTAQDELLAMRPGRRLMDNPVR